jgi:hypothetical protein
MSARNVKVFGFGMTLLCAVFSCVCAALPDEIGIKFDRAAAVAAITTMARDAIRRSEGKVPQICIARVAIGFDAADEDISDSLVGPVGDLNGIQVGAGPDCGQGEQNSAESAKWSVRYYDVDNMLAEAFRNHGMQMPAVPPRNGFEPNRPSPNVNWPAWEVHRRPDGRVDFDGYGTLEGGNAVVRYFFDFDLSNGRVVTKSVKVERLIAD